MCHARSHQLGDGHQARRIVIAQHLVFVGIVKLQYPAHVLLYGASTYVHPLQTKAALALMFVEHGVDIDVCSPQGDRGLEDVREEPDIVAALQKRALEKQLEHVLPQGSNRRKM